LKRRSLLTGASAFALCNSYLQSSAKASEIAKKTNTPVSEHSCHIGWADKLYEHTDASASYDLVENAVYKIFLKDVVSKNNGFSGYVIQQIRVSQNSLPVPSSKIYAARLSDEDRKSSEFKLSDYRLFSRGLLSVKKSALMDAFFDWTLGSGTFNNMGFEDFSQEWSFDDFETYVTEESVGTLAGAKSFDSRLVRTLTLLRFNSGVGEPTKEVQIGPFSNEFIKVFIRISPVNIEGNTKVINVLIER
jgi:hypothetical protein